jgi:antitoxin FitA
MASITIRNLDETLKTQLRVRAAQRGHSMEEEARRILRGALAEQPTRGNLADLAESLFGADGWEVEPHPSVEVRQPPDLDA